MAFASRRAAESVGSTADAAFASDEDGRIVACNGAAERLLGVASGCVLGRSCHQVVSGLDVFGNQFCRPDCVPRETVRRRQPLRGFELDVKRASGEFVRVGVSCLAIREEGSSRYSLVHLLRPSEGADSDCLEGMRIGARRCGESSVPEVAARAEAGAGPVLTARETQVLRLLAGGRNPREITAELGISLDTVRTHIRNLLRKLGVHGVTQAVTHALRRRLV